MKKILLILVKVLLYFLSAISIVAFFVSFGATALCGIVMIVFDISGTYFLKLLLEGLFITVLSGIFMLLCYLLVKDL